jgi:hypothetical protein
LFYDILFINLYLISVSNDHDDEITNAQFKTCALTIENIIYKWENKICLAYPTIFQRFKQMLIINISDYTGLSPSAWFNKMIVGQRFEYLFSHFFEEKLYKDVFKTIMM